MLPSCSHQNAIDGVEGHMMALGHNDNRARIDPDGADLLSGELCASVSLTNRGTSFRDCIPEVFLMGSEEQMSRVDAESIVATVADTGSVMAFALRNGTIGQFPSDPMRSDIGSIPEDLSVAASRDSSPKPARIGATALINPGPKTSQECVLGVDFISHVAPPCGVVRDRAGTRLLADPVNSIMKVH